MDVAAWLRGLGLERYEPAFRDNEIDEGVLPSLTAEDLKDLGVTSVGHRRKLLDAIAALGAARAGRRRDGGALGCTRSRRCRTPAADGDVLRPGRLDRALDASDPEDLREVIGAYHRAVAEIVAGFDGFVAKYMGDGVLIYFGYPQAHEDDAERAVRAGLGCDRRGRSPRCQIRRSSKRGSASPPGWSSSAI